MNTLSELMVHNEKLCKTINRQRELIEVYRKALTDLQAHPTAKKALDLIKTMEKKNENSK